MSESQETRSITDKQKRFLEQLIQERDEYDAPWFDELKTGDVQLDELSVSKASEYIEALVGSRPAKSTSGAGESSSNEDSNDNEARPLSEKQANYILSLLEKKRLSEDGMIDVDTLMARLTSRAGSHLIDALKYLED